MPKPLMSLLKGGAESYGPRREDTRKLAFLVGPRAQTEIKATPYDQTVLRRLSTMVGQPILLNGGGPGGM